MAFYYTDNKLNYTMRLSQKTFKEELLKIIDEDGISVEELANSAGLAKATLYNILNDKPASVQRAVVRKVAEATGRNFVINGDKVTFVIAPKQENDNLTEEEREFLNMFRQLDDASKDAAIGLLESMCRVAELGRKRRERSPSSEN